MTTLDVAAIIEARGSLLRAQSAYRACELELPIIRAQAEQRIVDAAGGDPKALGANEAERARAMLLALEADDTYRAARTAHADRLYEMDAARTYLESLLDERRALEWAIRDRLAAAQLAQAEMLVGPRGELLPPIVGEMAEVR